MVRVAVPAALLMTVVACARPQFPHAIQPTNVSLSGSHIYELQREVPGVGPVHERIISREPYAVAQGACAGTIELAVPGAPGGAQYYTAHLGCVDGNKVEATRKDSSTGQVWLYRPTVDQMMRARGVVLAERGDGVRWFIPDAVYESLTWSAVVHAKGHTHQEVQSAGTVAGRQMVVAMSMNSGFPGPGTHWDDVHVAVLDDRGNLLARLMMDPTDVGTHAGIQIQRGPKGDVDGLAFVGAMRDAAGQWRFVDLWLPVAAQAAKPPSGLGVAVNTAVTARGTQVLSAHPERMGHLWVDGSEWLGVDLLSGSLDETFHRPGAVIGGELSVNPSPEQGPTWRTTSAETRVVRLFQDRTWMGDTDGWLLRVPEKIRMGWSHVHEVLAPDGSRSQGKGTVSLTQMPYTSRVLRFPLPTGQYVRVVEELVGVTTEGNALEYGLRQTTVFER